jgi:hypothetical protein
LVLIRVPLNVAKKSTSNKPSLSRLTSHMVELQSTHIKEPTFAYRATKQLEESPAPLSSHLRSSFHQSAT